MFTCSPIYLRLHYTHIPHCIEASPLYNERMGYRRTPFAQGEWYHCYSRGVDKRTVFETPRDYERFLEALYLSNSKRTDDRGTFQRLPHLEILQRGRQAPIVAIGAYCLMPNHFHLLMKEVAAGGITKFMHRVGTSYTMYFNAKRERIGNLFVKPFRSKHVDEDRYLKRVAQYIHLNPVELFEPEWKTGTIAYSRGLQHKLENYRYSSLPDYQRNRIEKNILDYGALELLKEDAEPLDMLLSDAALYYAELDHV